MRISEILREIRNLPIGKRIYVIEKSIHSIRDSEEKELLRKATEKLFADDHQDDDLTVFTDIDYNEFYQAK